MFSLTLLKSPTSDDLLKEYRLILLEGIVTELMGNTILKGKYLSREEYVEIQSDIDFAGTGLNLESVKSAFDFGWRIGKGKLEKDYNVYGKNHKKEGYSKLTPKKWQKIWDATLEERRENNEPTHSLSPTLSYDEMGFPTNLFQFSDDVGNKIFPAGHKTPYYTRGEWLHGDSTSEPKTIRKPSVIKEYQRKVKSYKAGNKEIDSGDLQTALLNIEKKLVNKWGKTNKSKWQKSTKEKDLKGNIIRSIRKKFKGKGISDTQLLTDYKKDVKDEPIDRDYTGKKTARELAGRKKQLKLVEERGKESKRLSAERREARPQIEKDLLEILENSEEMSIYNDIQEALTTAVHGKRKDKAIPKQIEIISNIISDLDNIEKPTEHKKRNLPVLKRILEKLQVESPTKPITTITSPRTVGNVEIQSEAVEFSKNSKIKGELITFGLPFRQGRSPLTINKSTWPELSTFIPFVNAGEKIDDNWMRGALKPIAKYWIELADGIVEGFSLNEGNDPILIYKQLDEDIQVNIGKAIRGVRTSQGKMAASYPAPTGILQLFYKRYITAYPKRNAEEFSIFLKVLAGEMNQKLDNTKEPTEQAKYIKETTQFKKFADETLDKLIKIIKQGISVDTHNGQITHNFVSAYKAEVDTYTKRDMFLSEIFKIAEGKLPSVTLIGRHKTELEKLEREIHDKLLEEVPASLPSGHPNKKSILNYILNAHVEVYGPSVLGLMLKRVEDKEGDVEVVDTLTPHQQREKIRAGAEEGRAELDRKAIEQGFKNHKEMMRAKELESIKNVKEVASRKLLQVEMDKKEDEIRYKAAKEAERIRRIQAGEEPEEEEEAHPSHLRIEQANKKRKEHLASLKNPDGTPKYTKEEIDSTYIEPVGEDMKRYTQEHFKEKYNIGKSDILKTDKGVILESINSKEKKRIKTLLLHANPTEYFGHDFLKLGELIDVLKDLGVVKGNIKLDKKIIRYDDKNLKVVKLASRLRKLYESLYHDLREIVYPNKGGKLR